ncbi:unnamed protein product [Musa hybrid cultivar]
MEGVGARLGRSSTRYGPATVFSGPVRKWKKRWVPLAHPSSSASSAASANGVRSHLLLYKWAPVSSPANGAPHPEEPPPRKFRFVPISVIEEQKQEAAEKLDDKNKPNEADPSSQPTQNDSSEKKPDMNDVAMEEAQASDKDDDINQTNLDLNLGLKATDGDLETKSRNTKQDEGDQLVKASTREGAAMKTTTNSETHKKLKRKAVTPDLEMKV